MNLSSFSVSLLASYSGPRRGYPGTRPPSHHPGIYASHLPVGVYQPLMPADVLARPPGVHHRVLPLYTFSPGVEDPWGGQEEKVSFSPQEITSLGQETA